MYEKKNNDGRLILNQNHLNITQSTNNKSKTNEQDIDQKILKPHDKMKI